MLTTTKQNKVQVLLSYSKEHKKHLKEQKEIACKALSGLVRDAILKADGKITKTVALGNGFADLMIEGNISTEDGKRKLFGEHIKTIDSSVGAEKVYVFAG